MASWVEDFGSTHPVLCDIDLEAWDLYADGPIKPQYIVLDREMNILMKTSSPVGHTEAEAAVLDAL